MRSYLFLPSAILAGVLLYMPSSGETEVADRDPNSPPESQHQVVSVTDNGIEPTALTMKKEDSIAFLLNNTSDALINVEIDFGKHTTHCASGNLKIGEDGVIRSTKPVPPKDFASVCFHDRGTYNYTVYGLPKGPSGLKGSIVVE